MSVFKSKKEMAQAILDGKNVTIDGMRVYYDERYSPPFRISTNDLWDSWDSWESATLEPKWYENITKPVPCWVSDFEDVFTSITLITSYSPASEFPFIGSTGWKYAIPIKAYEVYENFED